MQIGLYVGNTLSGKWNKYLLMKLAQVAQACKQTNTHSEPRIIYGGLVWVLECGLWGKKLAGFG